jgi:hypothetical protein
MNLKNVDLNGDNVVANNLKNINSFYFLILKFEFKVSCVIFLQGFVISHKKISYYLPN